MAQRPDQLFGHTALPAQDGHLMSQGDELEFQRGAAAHPE